MVDLTEDEILRYLDMDDTEFELKILPLHAAPEGALYGVDNFVEQVKIQWNELVRNNRSRITRIVCVDNNYCQMASDPDVLLLVGALSGLVAIDAGAFSLPVTLVAIVALKYGWLDELCECNTIFRKRRE